MIPKSTQHNKQQAEPESDDSFEWHDKWLARRLPKDDEASMRGAERALIAWMELPESRKSSLDDPAAQALHDAAFNLLSSSQAKADLTQFGARAALEFDDAHALRGFFALGARFDPAAAVQSDHSAYAKSWEGSVLHECASKRRWATLKELAQSPVGRADIALCEALFNEPKRSPLRDLDPQLLFDANKKRLSKLGIDVDQSPEDLDDLSAATELLFALMNGQSEQSESLGMSIAVSDLLQGNPLFRSLRLVSEDARGSRSERACLPDPLALEAIGALEAAGLWNPRSLPYREALAALCGHETPTACAWAVRHGVSPADVGAESQARFMEKAARHGLSDGSSFADFCRPWSDAPGFADRLAEQLASQCARAHRRAIAEIDDKKRGLSVAPHHDIHQLLRSTASLAKALGSPGRGFSDASPGAIASAATILDGIAIEALERQPSLTWAKEAQSAASAFGALRLRSQASPRL